MHILKYLFFPYSFIFDPTFKSLVSSKLTTHHVCDQVVMICRHQANRLRVLKHGGNLEIATEIPCL